MRQPRVLAIHDISGVGRCSLTVALPVLSAAGIECSVLPTAVLSTHTGDFEGYTYRDLTADVLPMARHWARLDLSFDAIYTGYLGSIEQVELIKQVIALLRHEHTRVFVDPVMADKGKLYPGFSDDFPGEMRSLCAEADVVIPNLTEAAFLLGQGDGSGVPFLFPKWDTGTVPLSLECVHALLTALCSEVGAKSAVVTGVSLTAGELGAATYDATTEEQSYAGASYIPGMYHGSGDVFSSVLVASLIRDCSLPEATEQAVRFTVEAIRRTVAAGTEPRYGLNFEAGLSQFSSQFS